MGDKGTRQDEQLPGIPKPESTSEYEGAESRQPSGDDTEVKTESTSEYEGAAPRRPADEQKK
ncbi:hypothetical protein F8S13_09470 [Chloroflexia bacterium SDU3-3]|nr:hypothetical protein F8S13_09470 [Chloroflexia bacterium SDU3-3]